MDSVSKSGGASATPTKQRNAARSNRSKLIEKVKNAENSDPNVSTPGSTKSSKTLSVVKLDTSAVKSPSRNPNGESSASRKKMRERKFISVKKKCKVEELNCSTAALDCDICNESKCLCTSQESFCASQDDAVKNEDNVEKEGENEDELSLKRGRDNVFEEKPEPRSGRVMNLVKAFENLSVVKLGDSAEKVAGTPVSSSPFSPSELFLTSESLGLDSNRSHSVDSISTTSSGGQRSRLSVRTFQHIVQLSLSLF